MKKEFLDEGEGGGSGDMERKERRFVKSLFLPEVRNRTLQESMHDFN